MAEAFAKECGLSAASAGTVPSTKVNPIVALAMKEKGLDLSNSVPKVLTVEMIQWADIIVTMGCSVEQMCPKPMVAQLQKKLVDWHLEDPKGKPIEEVRVIRDEIERSVRELVDQD